MGCGEFLVKYILFFVNLFFALAGLALLGIGIAVQLKVSAVVSALDSVNVVAAPIATIVIGCVVFLIAFFGCCGAIRESNCMLISYAICMIVLMVLKIALGTIIFVHLDSLVSDIPRILNEAFVKDQANFQQHVEGPFQCCGTTGAISYLSVNLPDTCCATAPCNITNAYSGCNTRIAEFADTFGFTIAIGSICVAAVELVAVIFALCLANHARNKDRRSRY